MLKSLAFFTSNALLHVGTLFLHSIYQICVGAIHESPWNDETQIGFIVKDVNRWIEELSTRIPSV